MSDRDLRSLARELGVQTAFVDTTGQRRTASPEALAAVVGALDPGSNGDAARTLRDLRAERAARAIEPVLVAWDGRLDPLVLHGETASRVGVRIELEGGGERGVRAAVERSRTDGNATVRVSEVLPSGLHRLVLERGGRRPAGEALVLSAPTRIGTASRERDWGVFLPLHALVTEGGWGIGDLTGLAELADWVRSIGGGIVATLPLLAGFPDEASPYSPSSRLFWNERYVDVERELEGHPATRRLVRSPRFARAIEELRASELVDHAEVLRRKREVLERIAAEHAEDPELRRFVRHRPEVEPYARFRAAGERWGLDWRRWPSAARDGVLRPRHLDPGAIAYHRFAQFVTERQVAELGRRSSRAGAGLYLDMPLGTHPDGFDVWRYRDEFATGISVGAAPDGYFRGGQDWGFPPVHPVRARERGYGYVRACLRHVFRHAGVVRVDHVMGLHRQYWVPHGFPADQGVFVRYPAEEWYAALSLEAHRTGTEVVGEDLGTVPSQVHAGMRRHRVLGSYVVEYEAVPGRDRVPAPGASVLASLNTHDMPTFAAFWRGLDVADRIEDGLLREGDAEDEHRDRAEVRLALIRSLREAGLLETEEPSEREALEATLVWLARSDARFVVVNLEDLWAELRPVNVPGVLSHTNWRGKAARSLEELRRSDDVLEILRAVDRARSRAGEEDAA